MRRISDYFKPIKEKHLERRMNTEHSATLYPIPQVLLYNDDNFTGEIEHYSLAIEDQHTDNNTLLEDNTIRGDVYVNQVWKEYVDRVRQGMCDPWNVPMLCNQPLY